MKKYIIFLFPALMMAQVGIGTNKPDASAVLHLDATNKGLLFPKVNLQSATDVSVIATPQESLLVYNTNDALLGKKGIYYWAGDRWDFLFSSSNISDLLNISKFSSTDDQRGYTLSNFPGEELYKNGSDNTGWTIINKKVDIVMDRIPNENIITFTGMLQANNPVNNSGSTLNDPRFTVGLGIFVDGKLVGSKALSVSGDTSCSFREFTINASIGDLTVGSHTVSVGVRNRSLIAGDITSITYGAPSDTCSSLSYSESLISVQVFTNQSIKF